MANKFWRGGTNHRGKTLHVAGTPPLGSAKRGTGGPRRVARGSLQQLSVSRSRIEATKSGSRCALATTQTVFAWIIAIGFLRLAPPHIRRALADSGIEPIGVEVDSATLTVWVSGTRKDREGRLVPRKFVARRLETVVSQIKRHLSDRAQSNHESSAAAPQELGRRER